MDIAGMIALVIALTQVLKKAVPLNPNIIAVVMSVLVVAYKVIESGAAWTVGLVVVLVQVIIGAIGGFKVGQQLLSGGAVK